MSSVSAVVSEGGRIFSILDKGQTSAIQLPPVWQLVAQDAFNGKLLWKQSIPKWHSHIWPAKAGPARLPRRLVAIGDKVFVTLGIFAPVSMLDAASGKILKIFKNTEKTEEIIVSGKELFVVTFPSMPTDARWKLKTVRCWDESKRGNKTRPWSWSGEDKKKIIAIDHNSGKQLWSLDTPVAKVTLAADEKRVFFHDGENVICLDRRSGKKLWTSEYSSKPVIEVKSAPNRVI